MDELPVELTYILLLFGLFVVPRALQRFGVPTALTSLALGAFSGIGLGLFQHDTTIEILSIFGIVSLFLLAGLEVDTRELRAGARVIGEHLGLRVASTALVAFVLLRLAYLDVRAAVLVALALLTPSTGFILDSLGTFPVSEQDRFWIRSKAIASELLALFVLFVTVQANSAWQLGLSSVVLAAGVAALPFGFRGFARWVAPFAPRSEFSFLMILAVLSAYATRTLGVYYLVGAFVVGVTARGVRARVPNVSSGETVRAVELFASFFVPFYFFRAGTKLRPGDFSLDAILVGISFLAAVIPFRVGLVALHRMLSLRQSLLEALRVALALQPTLVFTLVIAQSLRDEFALPAPFFGGLVLYALANTTLPSLLSRIPPPAYDLPCTGDHEDTSAAAVPNHSSTARTHP
ncbi:MAG: cation:proton antiporter [Deltaproteobacteria bacterium]|nr:cation:proton antiporter [Deltaproteobacteria bacterium]